MPVRSKFNRNNPAVLEKLKWLKANWSSLSKAQKDHYVDELRALGCPNTEIGRALGLGESAIRHYGENTGGKTEATTATVRGVWDPKRVSIAIKRLQRMLEPPAPTRAEQVKAASTSFLHKFADGQYALQTVRMAQQRCELWECCGELPEPAPSGLAPSTVFDRFDPKTLELNPGAAVEFFSASLLQLMPEAAQRDQLLRELEAECLRK